MNSTALLVAFCGLIAAISWGTADFFAAKTSKRVSAEVTVFGVALVGAVAYSIFFLFESGSQPWLLNGLLFGVLAGLFMGLGLLFFYRGLEKGPVSIVSPVGSAYPLVTTLLVLTVLGGALSWLQFFGILLVVTGIVAASGVFETKSKERRLSSGVIYAIMTFLLWGVAFALLGQAVSSIGWQKTTLIELWAELIAITIALPLLGHRIKLKNLNNSWNKIIIGIALIQVFGLVIFDFGLTRTDSSAVITAISASYPALTIFLALKHFEEKQTIIALSGAFITIVGVIILSIV